MMCSIQEMKHQTSWITIFIVSLMLFAAPLPQVHARVLKIATVSPDGAMWMKKMREGAAEIAKRTQGRVEFKFYPGGVMGSDQSVLRKMRFGQLQGGAFTAGSLAAVYSDIQIYALPFLFASQKEVDFVRARMDGVLMKGLERNGLIGFGFAGGGFAYSMSTVPQNSLEALREHKVWVPAGDVISRAVMKAAGVSPIPLPISDVLTGLQTGMVDTVAVSPVGAIAFQWYTKVTYLMDAPISYIYALLVIDKKAFSKISPGDQALVREVMTRVYQEIDRQNRVDNDKAVQALQKQGVTFVSLSPSLLKEWQDVAKKAIKSLGEEGAFTPEMLKTLKNNSQSIQQSESSR